MASPNIKALLWFDCESTGLIPREDYVLDVGVIVTDLELNEITDYEALVLHPDFAPVQARLDANPIARQMHEDSGLTALLRTDAFLTLPEIDAEIASVLNSVLPGVGTNELLIAGSGVARFDHHFIDAQMPLLSDLLHYREVDLSVLRQTLQALGGGELVPNMPKSQDFDHKAHRGLADAREHLAEGRAYRNTIANVLEDVAILGDLRTS